MRELSVVGSLMTDVPVDLGDDVVDPALTHPVQDVSVQVIVGLQARGLAAFARRGFVAVDTEGADAEAHPRLGLKDGLTDRVDEAVDVLTAPLVLLLGTVTCRESVAAEGLFVVEL